MVQFSATAALETTQTVGEYSSESAAPAHVDLKLEVVALPVADVDRARHFYEGLGWRLDADFASGDWRVVQLTPPGSPCSVMFGRGFTSAAPRSVHGSMQPVDGGGGAPWRVRIHGTEAPVARAIPSCNGGGVSDVIQSRAP